jgi:hypothetical protein
MVIVNSSLIGLLLGLRFKAAILIPTILATFAIICIDGLLRGDEIWRIGLSGMAASTAVEVGYFGGSVIRFVRHKTLANSDSEGSMRRVTTPNV